MADSSHLITRERRRSGLVRQPRKRPGWPVLVFAYRAYLPIEPDWLMAAAARQAGVWRQLADLHDETRRFAVLAHTTARMVKGMGGDRTWFDEERKARWRAWQQQARLVLKTCDLPSAVREAIETAFQVQTAKAKRGDGGWPRPSSDVERIWLRHRLRGSGLPIKHIWGERGPISLTMADDRLASATLRFTRAWTLRARVVLHRPLPSVAYLKAVTLVGRRRPARLSAPEPSEWEWSLQLTLEVEPTAVMLPPGPRATVRMGWTHVPGGIRVATVTGEDCTADEVVVRLGRPSARRQGEWVRMPDGRRLPWPGDPALAQELERKVALYVEQEKAAIRSLIPARTGIPEIDRRMSAWDRLRDTGLRRLRDELEKAGLAPAAVARLTTWDREMRRLRRIVWLGTTEWRRARRNRYYEAAHDICRTYGTLELMKLNLARVAKRQAVPDDPALEQARKYRQWAAPGEFRAILRQVAAKRGVTIVERKGESA